MTKWEEKRLGEVAPFIYGKALTAEKRKSGKYKVFSSAGVCGFSDNALAKRGIIIGRKGSVGTVFLSESPFYCIDTAFYIDNVDDCCDMKFLFYYMTLLNLESYNNDAAVPGLNRNLAHKLKIKIPDLPTQQRIADILSAYDDLIENNNKRIALLEKAAQELYKEWFVRFRFPGHETTKFVNGLPEGWEYIRLGKAIEIIDGDRGTNYPKQEEFYGEGHCLFLNAGNVTKTGFDFSAVSFITEEKDKLLRKGKLKRGDVVLTTRGTVGNSAFYNDFVLFEHIRINSGMVILRDLGCVSPEYVYCLLNSSYMLKSMELYASGSAQPQLPIKDMRRIKVINPDDGTMRTFTEKVQKQYNLIALLVSKNQNLAKQRDLLLPRLMSGKLEV